MYTLGFKSAHNYYTAYQTNSNATDIFTSAGAETKKVMERKLKSRISSFSLSFPFHVFVSFYSSVANPNGVFCFVLAQTSVEEVCHQNKLSTHLAAKCFEIWKPSSPSRTRGR